MGIFFRHSEAVPAGGRAIAGEPAKTAVGGLAPGRNAARLGAAFKGFFGLAGSILARQFSPAFPKHGQMQKNDFQLGINAIDAGDWEGAEARFGKCVEEDPAWADAHNRLAHAKRNLGKFGEAIACQNTSLVLDPGNPTYIYNRSKAYARLGRINEAIADCLEAAEKLPDLRASIYAALGRLHKDKRDLKKAREYYKKSLELDGGNRHALIGAGFVCSLERKFLEALKYYSSALELEPERGFVNYFVGQTHSNLGHYDKALEYLSRAVELEPENPDFRESLFFGRLRLLLNTDPEAAFNEAQRQDLEYPRKKVLHYVAEFALSKDQYETALRLYGELFSKFPGFADAKTVYHFGVCHRKTGNAKEALRLFTKALKMGFGDEYLLEDAGNCLYKLKKYGLAEKLLRRSIEINPDRKGAPYFRLLSCMQKAAGGCKDVFKSGDEELFYEIIRVSESLIKNELLHGVRAYSATAHFCISRACYELGDLENALPDCKGAIGLEPENPHFRRLLASILMESAKSAGQEAGRLLFLEAAESFNEAIRLVLQDGRTESFEKCANFWIGLGVCYEKAGLAAPALEAYRGGLSHFPDDAALKKAVGRLGNGRATPPIRKIPNKPAA